MKEYFYRVPVGHHFNVENDDGTYSLGFKVLTPSGLEACILVDNKEIIMEFANPTMLVIL